MIEKEEKYKTDNQTGAQNFYKVRWKSVVWLLTMDFPVSDLESSSRLFSAFFLNGKHFEGIAVLLFSFRMIRNLIKFLQSSAEWRCGVLIKLLVSVIKLHVSSKWVLFFSSTAKDFRLTRIIMSINISLHQNHIEVMILSFKLYDIQNWKRNSYFLQRFFYFLLQHMFSWTNIFARTST